MENEDLDIPMITFELWTPMSREEYEVLVEFGGGEIVFYRSLPKLLEAEGIDSDYTSDFIPLYDELYAN